MQQMGNYRHVGHIRRRDVDVVHQPRFNVGAEMGFHTEIVLAALLRLMPLGIALAFLVPGSWFLVELGA